MILSVISWYRLLRSEKDLWGWICGRSASPTGCAFAHIPTGTTTNHRIDVDEEEHRSNAMTVATSAIGAGTEIGRVTP